MDEDGVTALAPTNPTDSVAQICCSQTQRISTTSMHVYIYIYIHISLSHFFLTYPNHRAIGMGLKLVSPLTILVALLNMFLLLGFIHLLHHRNGTALKGCKTYIPSIKGTTQMLEYCLHLYVY